MLNTFANEMTEQKETKRKIECAIELMNAQPTFYFFFIISTLHSQIELCSKCERVCVNIEYSLL